MIACDLCDHWYHCLATVHRILLSFVNVLFYDWRECVGIVLEPAESIPCFCPKCHRSNSSTASAQAIKPSASSKAKRKKHRFSSFRNNSNNQRRRRRHSLHLLEQSSLFFWSSVQRDEWLSLSLSLAFLLARIDASSHSCRSFHSSWQLATTFCHFGNFVGLLSSLLGREFFSSLPSNGKSSAGIVLEWSAEHVSEFCWISSRWIWPFH